MSYIGLQEKLFNVATQETRGVEFLEDMEGIPKGKYILAESYCDDKGCDCRRVFINFINEETTETLAVIAYGFEKVKFYQKWMGYGTKSSEVASMVGASLNLASKQSKYAEAILQFMKEIIFQDKDYVQRLKTHYKLFKETIDGKKEIAKKEIKIGRNEECFCGSGKKYKNCCLKNK